MSSRSASTRLADGFVERDLAKQLPTTTADASSAGAVALPTVRVGAQVAAVDALRAEMAAAQAVASDATAQQQAVLEMQNKVLLEQVAQMQSMMAKQQMLMSQYMTKWPTPLDEAERLLTVERSELMSMMPGSAPLAPVDAVVRELCASPLCADVYGVFVNIIDASFQKAISYSLRTPYKALREAKVTTRWMLPNDVSENVRGHIGIPRKLSSCQYVVATGQMFCHARSERDPFAQNEAMQLRDALADAGSTTEREKFDEILERRRLLQGVGGHERHRRRPARLRRLQVALQRRVHLRGRAGALRRPRDGRAVHDGHAAEGDGRGARRARAVRRSGVGAVGKDHRVERVLVNLRA